MSEGHRHFVDGFVSRAMSPPLREFGFARKGRVWNRRVAEITHVIDLQTGKGDTGRDSGSFTLNVGVFHPLLFSLCWDKPPPQLIREEQCAIRVRVGALMQNRQQGAMLWVDRRRAKDLWWAYESGAAVESLSREVVAAVGIHAVPFFDHFDSLLPIRSFLRSGHESHQSTPTEVLYLMIAEATLGNRDGAKALFREVQQKYEAWQERSKRAADALGLLSPDG